MSAGATPALSTTDCELGLTISPRVRMNVSCPGTSRIDFLRASVVTTTRRRTYARPRTGTSWSGVPVSERYGMSNTRSMKFQQRMLHDRGEKWCQKCNCVKPFDAFYLRADKSTYRSYCKGCHRLYGASPTRRAAQRNAAYHKRPKNVAHNRFRMTGFTQQLWDAAWLMQRGLCGICGCDLLTYHNPHVSKGPKMCADHDHLSRTPRGILCSGCNKALGFFKDDPARLAAAIKYLASPPLSVLV